MLNVNYKQPQKRFKSLSSRVLWVKIYASVFRLMLLMSLPLLGVFTCSISMYRSVDGLYLNKLKCSATGFFSSVMRMVQLWSK